MTPRPLLALDWQVGLASGWGTYGAMLCRYASRTCDLALIQSPNGTPAVSYEGLTAEDAAIVAKIPVYPRTAVPRRAILLTALGNHGNGQYDGWPATGKRQAAYGIIFSEDTQFHPEEVARLNTYDGIIAGSTWNADILTARGVDKVHIVRQGVDLDLFYPRTPEERATVKRSYAASGNFGYPPPAFHVFSGGKLEYRKGQDIVVAAFRELLKTVPDAVLVHAWHNHWPATMQSISVAGLTSGAPATSADIEAWLDANGIPEANRLDVGLVRNDQMPTVLSACDVAVFPNRAEGGTNLCLGEAIACGLPCISTFNTGQKDLPAHRRFSDSPIVGPVAGYGATDGWTEGDAADLASVLNGTARLTASLDHPSPLWTVPDAMSDWSWERSIARLLAVVCPERAIAPAADASASSPEPQPAGGA